VAPFRCLTFLTDYGLEDGFTAACHGVAAQIAPQIPVIDITHLIPGGDVRRGAAVLAQTMPYFPPAVHVAVVDPGVGTDRRGIAVAAGDAILVGPDNGLLSWAVSVAGGPRTAISLTNKELWLNPTAAPTFHGRDIFMPVAAHLAAGTDLAAAGTEIDVSDLVTLPPPASRVLDGTAQGEVLTVDTFGNVPGEFTGNLFSLMTPGRSITKYNLDLIEAASDDAKLLNWLRMEKWLGDRPDQPGEFARQWLKDLYQENKLVKGEFTLDGERVDLGRITMPVLNILTDTDHVIPPPMSLALKQHVGTQDYTELIVKGGHIGVFVGAKSHQELAKSITAWVDAR